VGAGAADDEVRSAGAASPASSGRKSRRGPSAAAGTGRVGGGVRPRAGEWSRGGCRKRWGRTRSGAGVQGAASGGAEGRDDESTGGLSAEERRAYGENATVTGARSPSGPNTRSG
jgi:hypothetical protein